MILVKIQGGLGNQLFQYAFGRALSIKNNAPLKLETGYFTTPNAWPFRLGYFNLEHNGIATSEELATVAQKRLLDRLKPVRWRRIVKDRNKAFQSSLLQATDPVFAIGYFQSEKYFGGNEALLRKELTVKSEYLSDTYQSVLREIAKGVTVSLHVRRGDYVKVGAPLASLEYYKKAIEKITSLVGNPRFIVMSDDIKWVKENLVIDSPCFWLDGSLSLEDYETMQLMASCKHHIIANSTFSWWGAWLNSHPDKIVIYPSVAKTHLNIDLMPDSWLEL